MKKAIITGVTGQDGSYLAENLLDKGYEVYGIARRVSTPNYKNINHLLVNLHFHIVEGDITDLSSLVRIFDDVQPDEIYNLAAQSFVAISWDQPLLTCNTTGTGALRVFEAARISCPKTKIYQASSSEMYDGTSYPQNETTTYRPRSPYGVSKLFAHEMARIYRESHGMFIVCGVLFNHESPRRGIEFVTQKIVDAVVRQMCGESLVLELGNIEAKRDWSHARDMVEGMWLMLQQIDPKDYILASGKTHTIMEFIKEVYDHFKIDIVWIKGTKGMWIGYDIYGNIMVRSVEKYYRPNEVNILLGDSTKARKELGWVPKYEFSDLVKDMIESRLLEYKGGK
jgi:GDPmannose 4,6-dehydratase